MNEPRRLSELRTDEFECDLILSARRDEPSPLAMRRALASLGIGISVPFGAAAAQGAVAPAKAGAAVLSKWLVTGVALGVATAGGAHVAQRAFDPRAASLSVAATAAPRAPAARVEKREPPSPAEAPPLEREATPPAPPAMLHVGALRGAPAPLPAVTAPPPSSEVMPRAAPEAGDSLAREVAAVDAARQALSRGAPVEAVKRLEAYEREFTAGALLPEARVLEVHALLAAGQRARAEALAERIIAADPKSSHAEVVRGLLSHNR